MENDEEIWRPYPDYPFIEVSNLGRVRTKDRTVTRSNGRKQFVKGRVLRQCRTRDGYMRVTVSVGNKTVDLSVHRIVATCFIPNPLGLPEVNHIDCNRANNRVDNLEWCTRQENVAYRDKLGHTVINSIVHPCFAVDLNSLEVFCFESRAEAAHQLNVNRGHINEVVNGKRNRVGDYWFCNLDENSVDKVRAKFGDEVANKVEKLMRKSYRFLKKTKIKVATASNM